MSLHSAARSGDKDKFLKLLKSQGKRALEERESEYEHTPLHVACEKGQLEIVQAMFDERQKYRADAAVLNAVDRNGWTALHCAAAGTTIAHLKVVEALLGFGAFPRATTNEGASPLHYLARTPCTDVALLSKVLGLMCQKGADANAVNKNGETPLHQAVSKNREQATQLLLAFGADPNLANKFNESALHYASRYGYLDLIKALLRSGADPLQEGSNGNAIKVAEDVKQTPIVDFLKQYVASKALLKEGTNLSSTSTSTTTTTAAPATSTSTGATNATSSGASVSPASSTASSPTTSASATTAPKGGADPEGGDDEVNDDDDEDGLSSGESSLSFSSSPYTSSVNSAATSTAGSPLLVKSATTMRLPGSERKQLLDLSPRICFVAEASLPLRKLLNKCQPAWPSDSASFAPVLTRVSGRSVAMRFAVINGQEETDVRLRLIANASVVALCFSHASKDSISHLSQQFLPAITSSIAEHVPVFVLGFDVERRVAGESASRQLADTLRANIIEVGALDSSTEMRKAVDVLCSRVWDWNDRRIIRRGYLEKRTKGVLKGKQQIRYWILTSEWLYYTKTQTDFDQSQLVQGIRLEDVISVAYEPPKTGKPRIVLNTKSQASGRSRVLYLSSPENDQVLLQDWVKHLRLGGPRPAATPQSSLSSPDLLLGNSQSTPVSPNTTQSGPYRSGTISRASGLPGLTPANGGSENSVAIESSGASHEHYGSIPLSSTGGTSPTLVAKLPPADGDYAHLPLETTTTAASPPTTREKVVPPLVASPAQNPTINGGGSAASPTQISTGRGADIDFGELILEDKPIGRGSSGEVYRALWRSMVVVAKKLGIAGLSPVELEKFTAEGQLMKQLRPHQNVVLFLGVCTEPAIIVTEYMPGGSLYKLLHSGAVIPLARKLRFARDCAAGMMHLHFENIIHRDLATRNLLLSKGGTTVKVADFGMSRLVGSDSGYKTASETGPLKWMAPESLTTRTFSRATDVWSFGVTLYEILAQAEPYPELQPFQAALAVITEHRRLPTPPDAPPELAALMSDCFDDDPTRRPTFEQLFRRLESIIEAQEGVPDDELDERLLRAKILAGRPTS